MSTSVFERHPRKTLSVVLLLFGIILVLLLEIGLRFIVSYDIGYYTAVQKQGAYKYPYGTISMNSLGFPDEEFNLDSPKRRIGYYGDSVIYGVGAGEGYRFPDLLQEKYPQYEHWITGMVSFGIQDIAKAAMAQKYDLDTVIYALNMNDLIPLIAQTETDQGEIPQTSFLGEIQFYARNYLDILRGKSYLYTATRTALKNIAVRMGYNSTGFISAEFFPNQNLKIIDDVTARINAFDRKLKEQGAKLCVIILPYEMQISNDAARRYTELGIKWEDGFLNGSTQNLIKERLDTPHVYNGLDAFKELKQKSNVGEYFVYNKGDKIDFNHPNRAGHDLLAKGFSDSGTCPILR